MKDFVKWLGVNEKVAKVVVWILIIMITLIIFNTAMESLGFPYYAITYDNLIKINANKLIQYIVTLVIVFFNFYAMVLLVFRVKEWKKILKYVLLYLTINAILAWYAPNVLVQVFIIIYLLIFCYLYSNKNWKYVFYGIVSYIITVIVEGIWYLSKARFIDYSTQNQITKSLLSLDYFIIMFLIILVKEIYLKKRSENNGRMASVRSLDRGIQKRKQICKETSKKSN